jgi:hypothetical protein
MGREPGNMADRLEAMDGLLTGVDCVTALRLAAACFPLLAGYGPAVQGAAVAELTSIWLAGFDPERWDDLLSLHIEAVTELAKINSATRPPVPEPES